MPLPAAAILAMKIGIPVASSILGGMGGKGKSRAESGPMPWSKTETTTPWNVPYYIGQGNRTGNRGEMMMADVLNAFVGLLGQQARGRLDPWQYASPYGRELFQGGMDDWRAS